MNIISYDIIEEGARAYNIVKNVLFKNANWFKTTLIEMLENHSKFACLENKEKMLIKKIITVDILDPDTVFMFGWAGDNQTYLRLRIKEYDIFILYVTPAFPTNKIFITFDNNVYGIDIDKSNDQITNFTKSEAKKLVL